MVVDAKNGEPDSDAALYSVSEVTASLFESLGIWLNIYDEELNIRFWNRVAEQVSGYRSEEIVGNTSIWDLSYPDEDSRLPILALARGVVENGQPFDGGRSVMLGKDGVERSMLWNSRPIVDGAGSVRGAITVGYDLTEIEQSRAALSKANRKLTLLLEIASAAAEEAARDRALEYCLHKIVDTLDTEAGTIHLTIESSERLELASAVGLQRQVREEMRNHPPRVLLASVLDGERELIIEHLEHDVRAGRALRKSGLHTLIGVPVRAKGTVLGVLTVFQREGTQIAADGRQLLKSIANQIGMTVESFRLHEKQEELAVFQERGRLARDLHDSVSQSLYSLALFAEAGRRRIDQGQLERAKEHLSRLAEMSVAALKEMRLLVYELRPAMVETDGLVGALKRRLEAVEKRSGMRTSLDVANDLDLPNALEGEIYRLAQEALNNALKHSNAGKVYVELVRVGDGVELRIRDDGCGFDPESEHNIGFGLLGMRERVNRLQGQLWVRSRAGAGTEIRVMLQPSATPLITGGDP